MTRYFLHSPSGNIYKYGDNDGVVPDQEEYAEVQIVPLDALQDARIGAWHRIAEHPLFKDMYDSDDTLINAMVAKLDTLTDAVVIEGPLPLARQADSEDMDTVLVGGGDAWSRDFVERCFLQIVAAKKWFDEHPAVDEAQVKAFAAILFGRGASWDSQRLAQHLVKHGARVEPKS